MKTYNVPIAGNVTVEADSPEEAIQFVQECFTYSGPLDSHDVLSSLEVDTTGVERID